MMQKTTIGQSVMVAVALNIAACSHIKRHFPDKEKDYQFTSEIPALQVPADLRNSAIENKPLVPEPETRNEPGTGTQAVVTEAEVKPLYTPVELVEFDGGAARLRIEEPLELAWRYVGKALSHESIEITGRNEKPALYVVQYDPNAKKIEDGALWDELVFLFGDDPAQEKEFHIRLTEKNRKMTEVIVLDSDDKPVSHGDGLKLLHLLKNTINQDLSKQ